LSLVATVAGGYIIAYWFCRHVFSRSLIDVAHGIPLCRTRESNLNYSHMIGHQTVWCSALSENPATADSWEKKRDDPSFFGSLRVLHKLLTNIMYIEMGFFVVKYGQCSVQTTWLLRNRKDEHLGIVVRVILLEPLETKEVWFSYFDLNGWVVSNPDLKSKGLEFESRIRQDFFIESFLNSLSVLFW
jgi:hypothetical protein